MTPANIPDEGRDGFPIEHLIDTSESGSWARDLLHAQPCITISEYTPKPVRTVSATACAGRGGPLPSAPSGVSDFPVHATGVSE